MKCITLSSGKQVCFDSTPKAQTGRYNIPLSKEEKGRPRIFGISDSAQDQCTAGAAG
jgi:hypothetical protein